MSYELKTRYIVIDIPMPAIAGLNIREINAKIPKDFVLITGFAAISKNKTGAIPPDAAISIAFNNRVINPIIVIEAEKKDGTRRKRKLEFWPLNEQVNDVSSIEGIVESLSKAVGVYNVKIIFRGKRIIKTD